MQTNGWFVGVPEEIATASILSLAKKLVEGFGTVLSNHSVRVQLGGTVTHGWNEAGLSVELSAPLERLRH
jgi:hypothetical protein